MEINITDYLTHDEIKEICADQVRNDVRNYFKENYAGSNMALVCSPYFCFLFLISDTAKIIVLTINSIIPHSKNSNTPITSP